MKKVSTSPQLSAIVNSEMVLEDLINELAETAVDRHDISIQGSPEQLNKVYGKQYLDPDIIQHSQTPPTQEPFLNDDFGWILAYSFSFPFIIGVVIGIFFIGDLFSVSDNFIYGALGGIVGASIGASLAYLIKKKHDQRNKEQEKQGGFVIWVKFESEDKKQTIKNIFNKYHAVHIETTGNA